MKKIIKVTIGLFIIAVFTLSILVGNLVADNIVYQNEGNDTISNSIKQLEIWESDTEEFDRKYIKKEISVTAKDGYKIPTYILGHDKLMNKDTILLVHGLGGDHVGVYPQAEMYLENNYNVIVIDQRASGVSEDNKLSFGHYEKNDIKNVLEYIRSKVDKKIIIHGFSLGGVSTGLYASLDHCNENVDAIILDSAFDSFKSVFLSAWDDMDTGISKNYAEVTGNILLKLKYGFSFEDINMSKKIGKSSILFLLSKA